MKIESEVTLAKLRNMQFTTAIGKLKKELNFSRTSNTSDQGRGASLFRGEFYSELDKRFIKVIFIQCNLQVKTKTSYKDN